MRTRPIVAIDGPAGAGKSTVARRVADALGFVLVDTGALYRAVAHAAKRGGIAWTDAEAVGDLARQLVAHRALAFQSDVGRHVPGSDGAWSTREGGVRVRLDGEDITDAIRTPDIAMGASTVSAHPQVREALLDLQRQAGQGGGVVLEGRDIGTVVFPDADVKFFLTARPEVRARRRHDELVAKGISVSLEETLDDVLRRDHRDSTRPVAPLRRAPDAMLLDDSDISVDETVARIVAEVRARTGR